MASPASPQSSDNASVSEIIQYVRTYAEQETIGPLKGAQRWLLMGVVGALVLSFGVLLLLLGLLRMLQTELFHSRGWSWVPYLIVAVVCVIIAFIAVKQISKKHL